MAACGYMWQAGSGEGELGEHRPGDVGERRNVRGLFWPPVDSKAAGLIEGELGKSRRVM